MPKSIAKRANYGHAHRGPRYRAPAPSVLQRLGTRHRLPVGVLVRISVTATISPIAA
jgi:hypothetical protein